MKGYLHSRGSGGALTALDGNTGKVIWRSKEFDPAQYSSPIVINHEGKCQYVQLVMKKLVGVDAKTGTCYGPQIVR